MFREKKDALICDQKCVMFLTAILTLLRMSIFGAAHG